MDEAERVIDVFASGGEGHDSDGNDDNSDGNNDNEIKVGKRASVESATICLWYDFKTNAIKEIIKHQFEIR